MSLSNTGGHGRGDQKGRIIGDGEPPVGLACARRAAHKLCNTLPGACLLDCVWGVHAPAQPRPRACAQ